MGRSVIPIFKTLLHLLIQKIGAGHRLAFGRICKVVGAGDVISNIALDFTENCANLLHFIFYLKSFVQGLSCLSMCSIRSNCHRRVWTQLGISLSLKKFKKQSKIEQEVQMCLWLISFSMKFCLSIVYLNIATILTTFVPIYQSNVYFAKV